MIPYRTGIHQYAGHASLSLGTDSPCTLKDIYLSDVSIRASGHSGRI